MPRRDADCIVFFSPTVFAKAKLLSVTSNLEVICRFLEPVHLPGDTDVETVLHYDEGDLLTVRGDIARVHATPLEDCRSARATIRHNFAELPTPLRPRKAYIVTIHRPVRNRCPARIGHSDLPGLQCLIQDHINHELDEIEQVFLNSPIRRELLRGQPRRAVRRLLAIEQLLRDQ